MAGYNQTTLFYNMFRKANIINEGGTLSATQTTDAINAVDDMVQCWQADGLRLWVQQDITLIPVSGQASYTVGTSGSTDISTDRPKRIFSARLHNTSSGIDSPMVEYSREEYNMLGDKTQTGQPTTFYYDPQIPNGVIYLYNVPDATTAAGYTIILTVQVPLASITASTTSLSFPNEWFQALKWGGAAEIGPDYQIPLERQTFLEQKAAYFLSKLEDWDREQASVRFSRNSR